MVIQRRLVSQLEGLTITAEKQTLLEIEQPKTPPVPRIVAECSRPGRQRPSNRVFSSTLVEDGSDEENNTSAQRAATIAGLVDQPEEGSSLDHESSGLFERAINRQRS